MNFFYGDFNLLLLMFIIDRSINYTDLSAMHIFLMYMNWLSVLAFNIGTQITLQETEDIRMPPVTSFYD